MRILGLNGFERDAAKIINCTHGTDKLFGGSTPSQTSNLRSDAQFLFIVHPRVLYAILLTAGVSSGRSGFKERYSSKQAETDKPLGFDSPSPTKLIIKLWKYELKNYPMWQGFHKG